MKPLNKKVILQAILLAIVTFIVFTVGGLLIYSKSIQAATQYGLIFAIIALLFSFGIPYVMKRDNQNRQQTNHEEEQ